MNQRKSYLERGVHRNYKSKFVEEKCFPTLNLGREASKSLFGKKLKLSISLTISLNHNVWRKPVSIECIIPDRT